MRNLLLGLPLTQRKRKRAEERNEAKDAEDEGVDMAEVAEELDAEIARVVNFLEHVMPASGPLTHALYELRRTRHFPHTADGIACRRAVLCFAMKHEREVADNMRDEKEYACDLRDRVLPFVTPRFVRNLCMNPRAYVEATAILAEMWEGEPLGNWPRAESAA